MRSDSHPKATYAGVSVRWTDAAGRQRSTHVGQHYGHLAQNSFESATAQSAQAAGEQFLRYATR